jgi:hypothetical protein
VGSVPGTRIVAERVPPPLAGLRSSRARKT